MPDEPTTRRNGGLEKREAGKRGYVYILINPAFADFVKIGKTTKDPEVRAREVSAGSGVPAPYAVAWDALVGDCDHVERMIHQQLAPARSRKDREFFALPLKRAIAVASGIAAPFACEGEESLPLCVEDSTVATMLSDASTVEVPSSDKAAHLIAAWSTAYPEARGPGSWRSTPTSVALLRKGFWPSEKTSRSPLTQGRSSSLMVLIESGRFLASPPSYRKYSGSAHPRSRRYSRFGAACWPSQRGVQQEVQDGRSIPCGDGPRARDGSCARTGKTIVRLQSKYWDVEPTANQKIVHVQSAPRGRTRKSAKRRRGITSG